MVKRTGYITQVLAGIFIATAIMLGNVGVYSQDAKPKPTPGDEDKVYLPKEVDVMVKVETQVVEGVPRIAKDCPKRGMVSVGAVLRKTGKVTDVKLIKGVGCSFDQQEIERIKKLKFTPARKSGRKVSQYVYFESWIPRL